MKALLLPSPSLSTPSVFVLSLALQTAIYYSACRVLFPHSVLKTDPARLRVAKARAWVLTTFSSLIMTLASLPFVADFVLSGGDVGSVQRREALARGVTVFFVAYLLLDLLFGVMHYRSQINVLTGWVHHSAYVVLLAYILSRDFAHIFALAAIMELPTFVLALAMLVPSTRSDIVFSTLFFLTRIAFHVVLIGCYATPYGRLHGTSTFLPSSTTPISSLVPVLSLCAAAPLHLTWFANSLRGQIRRARRAASTPLASPILPPVPASTLPPLSPFLLPARHHLVATASSYLSSRLPLVPRFPSLQRSPVNSRRYRIEHGVREFFAASDRDENDVLRVVGATPAGLRLRAGKRGEELKRFGGRLRRGVVGTLGKAF